MNSSDDVVIESGSARYWFRFLPWDTDFFGKPSYILDADRSNMLPSDEIARRMKDRLRASFVTAKIDTMLPREVHDLFQSAGFRYIDTEVTLKFSRSSSRGERREDIKILKMETNSGLPYAKLGSSYSMTRFHYDPHINPQKADALWTEYIKNYRPSAERHLFVATAGDEIAGTMLVNTLGANRAFLFYVAVVDRFRGRGIGSMFLGHIIEHFTGFEIRTGTQIRNIGAMNFYIRNGFSIIDATKTVLHLWGE